MLLMNILAGSAAPFKQQSDYRRTYLIHTMQLHLVDPEKPEARPEAVHYLDPRLTGLVAFVTRA
jgi:hypothetical protein